MPRSIQPINVDKIISNVSDVFSKEDIKLLKDYSYNHIITKMGFMAHYTLHGFQCDYENLVKFAEKLLTSEMGDSLNTTLTHHAEHYKNGVSRDRYGQEVVNSWVDTILGIRLVAIDYLEKNCNDRWILANIETFRASQSLKGKL